MDRTQEVVYLDTHVAVLLYNGARERLTRDAIRLIDQRDLLISPATVLELEILHEIGRLKPRARAFVDTLERQFDLKVCDLPFMSVVELALQEGWTRDPFDRLIVGNAKAAGAPPVTKDERILDNYKLAVWD